MKIFNEIDHINNIAVFLSKRDIGALTKEELSGKYGLEKVDLLLILGSSMPDIALLGAHACGRGLAEDIMIAGGIGHSTKYLVRNVEKDERYQGIETDGRPEADILKDILVKNTGINGKEIIIENKSTNCGSNAIETLKVLKAVDKVPKSMIIIQDPTMQMRTHASFHKAWAEEGVVIINYAPFIPQIEETEKGLEFVNKDISGLWTVERFIDLIMGEIPRLRDDENGYGPKGKGFIAHTDIPGYILEAYEGLLSHYGEYRCIQLRK